MASPADSGSSSASARARAPVRRWFATAMDRLRHRRRRSSSTSPAAPSTPPPRSSGASGPEASSSSPAPPAPTRRPPPPPPDPIRRPRPRTIPLAEIAAGRTLASWLPPSQRFCQLCRQPYDGANSDLERRTLWEERELAVRVPGCVKQPEREKHVVGRRCLERWIALGSSHGCPLCAFGGADPVPVEQPGTALDG
ncbi:hypothetical protein UCDDS831_g04228 [Diplodia seriata]|uniref:Uncharacterized protein n=1 Tax=Diplodia seriata TaxID=420778 RepID=A0A0G2EEV2_9PEZI|nr:hypothetical protein UCDDS831_g04228 [Diplodia seriata]